jgi:transposase
MLDDNERVRRLRLPESRPGRSRLDEYNRMVDEPRSYALSCGCPWTLLIESELQALAKAPFDVATFIFGFKFAGRVH